MNFSLFPNFGVEEKNPKKVLWNWLLGVLYYSEKLAITFIGPFLIADCQIRMLLGACVGILTDIAVLAILGVRAGHFASCFVRKGPTALAPEKLNLRS